MLCPDCGNDTFVNRTMKTNCGTAVVRIRICKKCLEAFRTEESPIYKIKRNDSGQWVANGK
jgi:transcriptional regulator NrdR family protein